MKYFLFILIALLFACNGEKNKIEPMKHETAVNLTQTGDVKLDIFDFNGLEKYLHFQDDKTYVVNFWATWCAPCIKELPYFETLNKNYKDQDVEVMLVSLDFPRQYEKRLKPFIKENNLQSKILVLDDPDMNTWIPKVNENWDGAIPVTLIYNKNMRQFYAQTFTYDELETELKRFIN